MQTNAGHGKESGEQYKTEFQRLIATQGPDAVPEKTVHFPVTVPEDIEDIARERLEFAQEQLESGDEKYEFLLETSEQQRLTEYILDHYSLEPQFLTRDVVSEDIGEPLTHAVYSCITEEQYSAIVDQVETLDDVDTVQEFVREAALEALEQ